jgi:hypothetical protein
MPHLSLPFASGAPIIDLLVGVSKPRADALKAAGQPVPQVIPIRALIDTGASCTGIDSTILKALGVPTTGTTPCHTPSTKDGQPDIKNQFDVGLMLVHPLLTRTFFAVAVIESELRHQGIHAILGRDILAWCLFTYDGQTQNFCLGF